MWVSRQVRRGEGSGREHTVGVVEVEEAWTQVMNRVEGRLVKHGTAVHHWKAEQKQSEGNKNIIITNFVFLWINIMTKSRLKKLFYIS